MIKTSTISARIDPELKNRAERVFREFGLTSSRAITLFYKQVELQQDWSSLSGFQMSSQWMH
jgi:DNA-damage-inducible protein J